jgi:hypothetical protein
MEVSDVRKKSAIAEFQPKPFQPKPWTSPQRGGSPAMQ